MARVKGGLFTATLDVNKRFPLDSRMLVTKRVDLINPTVWATNTLGTEATYNGMIVAVNSDGEYNGVYYLIDRTGITADNYSAYKAALEAGEDVEVYFSMWQKLANAGSVMEKSVVNADTHYEFPSIGSVNTIYKAQSEKKIYQWNPTELKYELLGEMEGSIHNITLINGGGAV
jgi:hypothetical protein